MKPSTLVPFTVKHAVKSDFRNIQTLIYQVRINPTGLDWRRFMVAISVQNELIGCGQVKSHKDGSRELASLAVNPKYQGHGVAKRIIEHLLDMHPLPIYLTCRSGLGEFYQRFGFSVIASAEMPPYFRRIFRLAWIVRLFRNSKEILLVMRKD